MMSYFMPLYAFNRGSIRVKSRATGYGAEGGPFTFVRLTNQLIHQSAGSFVNVTERPSACRSTVFGRS